MSILVLCIRCFARPGPARPRGTQQLDRLYQTSLDSSHHISRNLISSRFFPHLRKLDPVDPPAIEVHSRLVVCPTLAPPPLSTANPSPSPSPNPNPHNLPPYLLSLRRLSNSRGREKNLPSKRSPPALSDSIDGHYSEYLLLLLPSRITTRNNLTRPYNPLRAVLPCIARSLVSLALPRSFPDVHALILLLLSYRV